jgi:hypothetical protein
MEVIEVYLSLLYPPSPVRLIEPWIKYGELVHPAKITSDKS